MNAPESETERLNRAGRRAVGGAEARSVRSNPPPLIHNLWIRLKKRSKAIERTCLVEWDRPYSPSLDGGLQRRQSTAGRKAPRSHSDWPRKETPGPKKREVGDLF